MTQLKKEDIIDERGITEALDRISKKVQKLMYQFNELHEIKDEVIFTSVAIKNDINVDGIAKIIRNIRKAKKKLKLRPDDLHGVYLALGHMVSKSKTNLK